MTEVIGDAVTHHCVFGEYTRDHVGGLYLWRCLRLVSGMIAADKLISIFFYP